MMIDASEWMWKQVVTLVNELVSYLRVRVWWHHHCHYENQYVRQKWPNHVHEVHRSAQLMAVVVLGPDGDDTTNVIPDGPVVIG